MAKNTVGKPLSAKGEMYREFFQPLVHTMTRTSGSPIRVRRKMRITVISLLVTAVSYMVPTFMGLHFTQAYALPSVSSSPATAKTTKNGRSSCSTSWRDAKNPSNLNSVNSTGRVWTVPMVGSPVRRVAYQLSVMPRSRMPRRIRKRYASGWPSGLSRSGGCSGRYWTGC